MEPHRERYFRLLEDRPRKRRDLERTAGTMVLLPSPDARKRPSARTARAVPPLEYIFEARVIRRESPAQTPNSKSSAHAESVPTNCVVWGYSPISTICELFYASG